MPALEPQYMEILKRILAKRFVQFLPPLLDTTKSKDEQHIKQLSRAFSAFTLNKLLDITPQEAAASVVDDIKDKGIDAIYYHASSATLYLLQAKLKNSEQFKQEDALSFCEGVRLLLRQEFNLFNKHILNRKAEIENALDICSNIKLVIAYTGEGISETALDVLQSALDDEGSDEERLDQQVEYYTATEITRDLLAEQAYNPVNTKIRLQNYAKIEEPRLTYYGVIQLKDLVALHEQYSKALYERNIRYFLGSNQSDVNKAIKVTLHEYPADFFYLNNGITAVCNQIEPKGEKDGAKRLEVRGLSIINGAQTVASAAEFAQQYPDKNIDEAKVMLTLIQASSDGQFGKSVTKARNHQNPVQTANFASLDENQERLRQEIACLGFNYHYRTEAPIANSGAITLYEAIRALASLQKDPRYTAILKREPARLANPDSTEYQTLFTTKLSGIKLVNAVLCHRVIRELVVGYEQQAPTRSQEKLIYRHALHIITVVMMKRLCKRINSADIIDPEIISTLISQPLDQLRQQTFELGQPRLINEGPLAYFRNRGNVVVFLSDLMVAHFNLGEDPAIASLRNIQNTEYDEYPRKQLFDYLSDHAPQIQEK